MKISALLFPFASMTTCSSTPSRLSSASSDGLESDIPKRLLLIRHGRSLGNDLMSKPGNEWGDSTFMDDATLIDSPLSEIGIQQAQELCTSLDDLEKVELVVVSPLTRALQTMQHALLPKISKQIPIVAHPLSTERVYTASDTGRKISELSKHWAKVVPSHQINFDLVPQNEIWWFHTDTPGPEWRPCDGSQWYAVPGEPESTFHERIQQFEQWLAARPEKYICVVGHWAVLRKLTNGYDFANCEAKWVDYRT